MGEEERVTDHAQAELGVRSKVRTMKVVSIDPAPAKQAVIFDGELRRVTAAKLPSYCSRLAEDKDTLLCWDAPLTGPPNCDNATEFDAAFSQRVIERFFSRAATGFKAPGGISVLPYSGCPHWAISRACVGLPRVGRFDARDEALPYRLCENPPDSSGIGPWIVETHPAVAIWLWCRSPKEKEDITWVYKGRNPGRTLQELWSLLLGIWATSQVPSITDVVNGLDVPNDDDELDVLVGWVLGMLLAQKHPSVTILGDLSTGAIVLPVVSSIVEKFAEFRSKNRI